MTTRESLHIRVDAELVAALDKSRGDATRSMFIERALDKYLKRFKDGGIRRPKK